MEEWSGELPECPVCLQSYDGEYTIPRVLSCGHTTCESCLRSIPEKYPQTIRCPACTQLVKYPSVHGPSSLPKNIDLLRLIPTKTDGHPAKPHKRSQDDLPVPHHQSQAKSLWSDEFYATWKNWVLPEDSVSVAGEGKGDGVRLLRIGGGLLDVDRGGSGFKASYAVRILSFLSGMKEKEREELGLVLEVCSKEFKVCKVNGLWGDLEAGDLYLVSERLKNGNFMEKFEFFEDGFMKGGLSGFAMLSMEICEAVVGLHYRGLILGCLGLSCFEFDDFGHLKLSLIEVLTLGRLVHESVSKAGSGERSIGGKEVGILIGNLLKSRVLLCPEVVFEILKNKMEVGFDNFGYSVGYSSDVWTLAFILLTILIGKHFIEVLVDHVDGFMPALSEDNSLDCLCFFVGLPEKVRMLLKRKYGDEFESLQGILCRCLNVDPASRPSVIEIWKCAREMITAVQFSSMLHLDGLFTHEDSKGYCLVNGEMCQVPIEKSEFHEEDRLMEAENADGKDIHQAEEVNVEKGFVAGLVKGNVKSRDMQSHRDCVTGLAVGGGFLFSSSFDKSVKVWCLKDFSHVHTFTGHDHKIMAVIYVDEERPLCISGDSKGGIFIWSIIFPLGNKPLKKWHEQIDWRYSGIHALTTAGNGYLYTGSGDRSIKKWSLQDGTLSCTMDGHKSVVSTLAASAGVLYSGSWDGTIRLWSLCDDSLLTVLGEDVPGNVTSVTSLFANGNILVAGHENGHIKIWRNDVFMKSVKLHNGAIFALEMEGNLLFTGGWDKTINVQEFSGDELQLDIRPIGSLSGGSVVTALLLWQEFLFVGYGDRNIKVFYCKN